MRRALAAILGATLVVLAPLPAFAANVTAYAETQPFLLAGHSVAVSGDTFFNGRNFAPVTLIYEGHVYIAVRYVAELARTGIGWVPRLSMITLGGGPISIPRAGPRVVRRSFSGAFSVQPRYLRLVVNGREKTPAGRALQVGSERLPDALYAINTSYMPASLLAGVLDMRMTWPKAPPTGNTLRAGISLPVRSLEPGSVLGVAANVSGNRPGDAIGYLWTLYDPSGNPAPMMDGIHAQRETVPFGANAQRGTYTLKVVVTDGRTGEQATASVRLSVTGPPAAGLSLPPFGFDPQTIARAYNIYNTWIGGDFGQGQEIVLYERQGIALSDITTFDNTFGLPTPNINVIHPGGAPLPSGEEATMDVEWAHAIAPLAQILVVEDVASGSAAAFPQDLANSLRAASFEGASIASVSYGVLQDESQDGAPSQTLQALLDSGMSIFAAAGDNLETAGPPALSWPGADPSVVSVGGTSLYERTLASFFETYWNGPGSGSSYGQSIFPAPYWQEGLSGDALRMVPDVSFDGNLRTGVAVFWKGTWWMSGGTSLGAPAWAAIWALVRTAVPAVGNAPRALYTVAGSRFDNSALHTPTGLRYDPMVGVGSPDVANLISALRQLY